MLKALRDNVRHFHWVLWLVIAAFIAIAFVGIGVPQSGELGGAAATVGDAKVTFRDVENSYRNLETRYRQMFGEQWSSEMADQFGIYRQAVEQVINQKVLLLEAERLGLAVSDEELREAILEVPAFQENGRFIGQERYLVMLQRAGYGTTDDFETQMRQDLLFQKVFQVIGQTVYLSEAEVEQAYRDQVEKASIRYLQVPSARFADQAQASEEELTTYLAENAEEYRLPEQREVAYLLVDRNLLRNQVEIDDAELQAAYDDSGDQFENEEQVQARHILLRSKEGTTAEELRGQLEAVRARIEGGEDFGALAQEVSEDPSNASRGGDLGFFGRGQMVGEFEQAAFNAEVGEVVGPIETQFGQHLIQVTGKRPAGKQPFEEVREQLRFQLAQERVGDLARDRVIALATELGNADGGASAEAMRAAAEADPSVFFYEPPPFGAGDAVAGLGRAPDFTEAAFELEAGDVSSPVEVPRGWAVMLGEQALPSREATLEDVEPQVRRAVETEKRQQAAVAALEEARQRLDSGTGLDEVAGELGLTVEQADDFSAAGGSIPGLGVAPQVARAAMDLDEGQFGGPFATPAGAVVFEVTSRQRFDRDQFESAKEQTRQQLTQQRAGVMQSALIQQRRDELGVEYSRQVLDQIGIDAGEEGAAGG
ncbi:MAG TPA: SurA N-terminal domain-containing protein [Thermoanaerobaculia bacterium]|nr:SurA N-terminal domain-containing protein [Thermoanaerobaculia bacterium]